MITKFQCSNNEEHIYDSFINDGWCPNCDISSKPMLVPFQVEEVAAKEEKIETLPNIDTELITSEIQLEDAIEEEKEFNVKAEEEVEPEILFEEIIIGDQIWMKDFLGVVKFRNGDEIRLVKNEREWVRAKESREPAWCYAGFDSSTIKEQGILFNYYAVNHPAGLAPKGWRIPNKEDVEKLALNGPGIFISDHIRQFSEVEISHRLPMGSFVPCHQKRMFWTATNKVLHTAICFEVCFVKDSLKMRQMDKSAGFFVRCIKEMVS
jgi:hypothetical protein